MYCLVKNIATSPVSLMLTNTFTRSFQRFINNFSATTLGYCLDILLSSNICSECFVVDQRPEFMLASTLDYF